MVKEPLVESPCLTLKLYNRAIVKKIQKKKKKTTKKKTLHGTGTAQHRQVDQWNRIEDPEMNPHTYSNLIFDKGGKTIQWKEDSIFNKRCWFNWRSAWKRM